MLLTRWLTGEPPESTQEMCFSTDTLLWRQHSDVKMIRSQDLLLVPYTTKSLWALVFISWAALRSLGRVKYSSAFLIVTRSCVFGWVVNDVITSNNLAWSIILINLKKQRESREKLYEIENHERKRALPVAISSGDDGEVSPALILLRIRLSVVYFRGNNTDLLRCT